MRLDINYTKKNPVKNTNTWRLNNTFLNNQQDRLLKKSKDKSKKFLETNDNENRQLKTYGMQQKQF